MPTSATLLMRLELESEADDTTGVWQDWSEAASPAVVRAPRIQRPAFASGSGPEGNLMSRTPTTSPNPIGRPFQIGRASTAG